MPTALVTGATAGIGAAFARRLATDGFSLVLLARDKARLEEAAQAYRENHNVEVEVIAADLATDEGMVLAEERLRKGVDLLINNAGFGHPGRFLKVPIEDELTMLRLHCEAVLRLTSAALPGMIERKQGGVINVASVAAFFARGTYSASKAWVVSFSDSIMQDLGGTGVHVMALCPGFVHTEFHDRAQMDMSGVPDFMWFDADKFVGLALNDYRKNVVVSIPGANYKALVGLSKLIPRAVSSRLSSRAGRKYDHD